MSVLLRDVRLGPGGEMHDVMLGDGLVMWAQPTSSDRHLSSPSAAAVVDGRGLTLLPGLVDHHVHLGAWLRSRRSATLDSPTSDINLALARVPADSRGWRIIFGVDHHHEIASVLDAIDKVDSPVLVVHRTGRATLTNAAAARQLGVAGGTGVHHERGLWTRALGPTDTREDQELLASLRDQLLGQGVVAVEDATPYRGAARDRCDFLAEALFPLRVTFMSDPTDPLPTASWVKILDPRTAKPQPGPVAVHAVEPTEILDALSLIRCTDEPVRSRIEHVALCPPALVEELSRVGPIVCANPGFLLERVAGLGQLRASGEGEMLHPVADLMSGGLRVWFGSDAPVTEPGVWPSIYAACQRGDTLVPFNGRRVTLSEALGAVTSLPLDCRARAWVGQPADVILVDLDKFLELGQPSVGATWVGGEQVHYREGFAECSVQYSS